MKAVLHPRHQRASTMTDVLIVVVTLVVLAFVLLPYLAGRPVRAARIQCVMNLKQVGLAFRIWSTDKSEDKLPWLISTNGGTAQFVDSTNVFLHFRVISNELSTPKVFVCPKDPAKRKAANFGKLANQNISYFIGLTANEADPQSILSGDRNLTTNGMALAAGVFTLSTNNQPGWTAAIHNNAGNIGLADGSVIQASVSDLQKQWQFSTNAARRLAIP